MTRNWIELFQRCCVYINSSSFTYRVQQQEHVRTLQCLDEVTMKQDIDAVNVPACFISNHEGFLGSIKNFIKDFVVTEIDITGQRVNTAAAAAAATQTPDWASSDKNNESSAECKWNNYSVVSQDTDFSADCGLDVTIPSPGSFDLSVILGQPVSEELEQFVLTLKEKPTKQELSLGSFADKHHRANVHRAVRHRFPFLMTVTIQPEIRVREDPDYRELSQLVTEDEAEDFFRFIDAKVRGSSYMFGPDNDKEHRTAVHHFLSRRFGKLVETKSFTDQGTTAISVRLREQGRPKKRTAEERKEEEVYTAFTLRKENLETLEAISYMAAALGVLPSDFTYAGIKDKRAITYQSMVVKKVSTQRLKEKTAEFEKRGMRLSQIRSISEPLRLGRLQGNHFDLVVRDLRPHSDAHSSGADKHTRLAALVKEAVENVKARGFVNYYGPQRFGNAQSIQSDCVGLALLKEDMVSAVRLFFTPEDSNDPQSHAKRHFLQTDNAKESLALMPLSKARERLMLRALNRYGTGPDGCTQAWLSLPHSMRVFYPHAYCSRVWNEAVAHRLTTLGHTARQGDLVWMKEDTGETSLSQIHVVTDQEEQEEVYTLGHVLLPMPGNTVKYPENAMGTWFQERLARDGLDACRFRVSNLKLNLPGCYRPLLALPRNLSYQLQSAACGEGGGEGPGNCSRNSDRQLNGTTVEGKQDLLTLTLNLDLDSSCYATICLREIMKCDP
ncbi:pseudouridylate synthase PUS7L isoform X1 [Sander vitreus]